MERKSVRVVSWILDENSASRESSSGTHSEIKVLCVCFPARGGLGVREKVYCDKYKEEQTPQL